MNFNELSEEELERIKYKIFSLYPLIYYKIVRFKEINFKINNDKLNLVFKNLFFIENNSNKEKALLTATKIIKDAAESIFIHSIKKNLTHIKDEKKFYFEINFKNKIIEFSKLFFPYNQITSDYFYKERINLLEVKSKTENINDKLFLHDGWWNNYFGPVVDVKTRMILEKEINNKKLMKKRKKEDIEVYYRTYLTYAYRLAEINEFKKIKKVLRKKIAFFFLNYFIFCLRNEKIYTAGNKLYNFIFSYANAKIYISRYKTNFLMLLYRVQNNNKRKLKLIKKIDKINDYQKLIFYFNILKIPFRTAANVNSLIRPQQILKSIEYSVDKYVITKDDKIIAYINFLLIEFARFLGIIIIHLKTIYF